MIESQLRPLFNQCGTVIDVQILRERATGQSRGCAFVGYETSQEAEAAIEQLNHRVHLPGAATPLEVRFARSRLFIPAGSGPSDNRQLFFSRAPLSVAESELEALFARFGTVDTISLFREHDTRASKGCGLVMMASREEAVAAMDSLDERHTMDGAAAPLSVKWADTDLRARRNTTKAGADAVGPPGDQLDDRSVGQAPIGGATSYETRRC
ncbi:CUG-BP- and ETR-3-like factor 5 [Monoraphidium neglectum]|uniref:CUG-BP-and ETR-3-like factor 5 n=1 Tax=Monoraphidium neglectum TaxID=145388 RepID=A0A0D2L5I9_9CHLO|nr:CUG-BP- and ETR-3-like factor 5 [Monoraphidium neglectum]KIZ02294.1 CUG-BP- and ETR-3-like factor 5 [Monoraphidium neglectum]|eukprot:XP_013901313.1 CUG-BP- and ETR-3-like factor 5 [Monoraphidium neglectum]